MNKPNLEKRLEFILEDINIIEECLKEYSSSSLDLTTIDGEPLFTLFNNIRIACDLKDDEPETNWK